MRNDYYSDVYKVKDLFSDLQKSKAGNCLMVKSPGNFRIAGACLYQVSR